jgi:hypothetical protein
VHEHDILDTFSRSCLKMGADSFLLRWAHGVPRTYPLPGRANTAGMGGVEALAASPDGTVWVGIAKAGTGLGLQRLIDLTLGIV